MKIEYDEHILKSCEDMLQRDGEYIEIQNKMTEAMKNKDIDTYSELSICMQMIVQVRCYELGQIDIINKVRQ